MNKLIKPGRIMFALGIAALGMLCIISKDFIVGRPPAWQVAFNINPVLAYTSGSLLLLAAIALFFRRAAWSAALLIAGLIFSLSILRHLPHFMNDWANAYKSIALFGGALIIAASASKANSTVDTETGTGFRKNLVVTGCILIAAFFIASGYAHFKYVDFIKVFIPSYIPFHVFLAYFTGVCLFAGGVGLIIPPTRKWAALFSAIMIMGWFILLHIPRFIANTNDPSDRMGLFESFTFAGILFTLAGILAAQKSKRI